MSFSHESHISGNFGSGSLFATPSSEKSRKRTFSDMSEDVSEESSLTFATSLGLFSSAIDIMQSRTSSLEHSKEFVRKVELTDDLLQAQDRIKRLRANLEKEESNQQAIQAQIADIVISTASESLLAHSSTISSVRSLRNSSSALSSRNKSLAMSTDASISWSEQVRLNHFFRNPFFFLIPIV